MQVEWVPSRVLGSVPKMVPWEKRCPGPSLVKAFFPISARANPAPSMLRGYFSLDRKQACSAAASTLLSHSAVPRSPVRRSPGHAGDNSSPQLLAHQISLERAPFEESTCLPLKLSLKAVLIRISSP